MKLYVLSEDIRYEASNRAVYRIATHLLDSIINLMPDVECAIYSASEEICQVAVKYGEYYNKVLKKKSFRLQMALKVDINKKMIIIDGTNIKFPIEPGCFEKAAQTVNNFLSVKASEIDQGASEMVQEPDPITPSQLTSGY